MILDVAAAEHAPRLGILESGEDIGWILADDVDDDVQPAAMAHPEHDLDGTGVGGADQDFVEQRDQRDGAFERKALRPRITCMKHVLEDFGSEINASRTRSESNAGGSASSRSWIQRRLSRIWNVHELCADRAAIATVERTAPCGADAVEFSNRSRFEAPKRIQVGLEIAPASERVENPLARIVASPNVAFSGIVSRADHDNQHDDTMRAVEPTSLQLIKRKRRSTIGKTADTCCAHREPDAVDACAHALAKTFSTKDFLMLAQVPGPVSAGRRGTPRMHRGGGAGL